MQKRSGRSKFIHPSGVHSVTDSTIYRFSLKFQQIVEEEQESNFITRLHNGDLMIIPWPVIESRRFYTLYSGVKRLLDDQPITHHQAGIFLQTMKTLMAKLKV